MNKRKPNKELATGGVLRWRVRISRKKEQLTSLS